MAMVARNGYQRLARHYAEKHDILLLTSDDLPQLHTLVMERLQLVALPDATAVGEPFWTIMEIEDDHLTGSYFVRESPTEKNVFLFYCKLHAEQAMVQM